VRRTAVAVAVAAIAALPGSASAANLYVDNDTGSNASPNCVQGAPCQTIVNALTKTGSNDRIFVDGGEYNGPLVVGDGVSLVAQDFVGNPEGETVIDSVAAMQPAILVAAGDPAGTIRGFTIRSDFAPVKLDAAATIRDNILDEPDMPSNTQADVWIGPNAGTSEIEGNAFSDSDTSDDQSGVMTFAAGSPQITGNTFTDLATGVDVERGTPRIARNDIAGYHSAMFSGFGIAGNEGNPTIVRNLVHAPGVNPGSGIILTETPTPGASGARLLRNRVRGDDGTTIGVAITDTAGTVTMDGDVVSNHEFGIQAGDNGADGGGDFSARNVTVFDNDVADIFVNETQLKLDSSIVGAEAIPMLGSGAGCTITFSRGPSVNPPGPHCEGFQTAANPMFVDAAAGNYHLEPGSPMIDAGNPAPPPPGALDFDGNPRAIDGNGDCTVRRDIGADERATPPNPACTPPSPPSGDEDPPETEILKHPRRKSRKRKAKFRFTANETGATFECALDKEAFAPCASPFKRKVKRRRHEFAVRSIDGSGNVDPTPAEWRWKVKKRKKR
jgi:hypothetical protein